MTMKYDSYVQYVSLKLQIEKNFHYCATKLWKTEKGFGMKALQQGDKLKSSV